MSFLELFNYCRNDTFTSPAITKKKKNNNKEDILKFYKTYKEF